MNAVQRRYDGIQAVNNQVVTVEYVEGTPVQRWHMRDADEIASLIRATLAPLGRTTRWQEAVETWAATVVLNKAEEGGDMEWAFFQYGIYAAYAAE